MNLQSLESNVWLGLAGILALLCLLALMFRAKAKGGARAGAVHHSAVPPIAQPCIDEAAPPLAALSSNGDAEIVVSLKSAAEWQPYDTRFREGVLVANRYRLAAGDGVRSASFIAVSPGQTYRVDYVAAALKDATNTANTFVIGPLFVDASGKVLSRWTMRPTPRANQGAAPGAIEAIAPAGAVSVHIGMGGPAARAGATNDGIVEIISVRLSRC